MRPNVRAKPTVEADADWPRKNNSKHGLERPDGGCRSGSALERGVRPHCVRSEAGRWGWSVFRAACPGWITGALAVRCRSEQALLGAGQRTD